MHEILYTIYRVSRWGRRRANIAVAAIYWILISGKVKIKNTWGIIAVYNINIISIILSSPIPDYFLNSERRKDKLARIKIYRILLL